MDMSKVNCDDGKALESMASDLAAALLNAQRNHAVYQPPESPLRPVSDMDGLCDLIEIFGACVVVKTCEIGVVT